LIKIGISLPILNLVLRLSVSFNLIPTWPLNFQFLQFGPRILLIAAPILARLFQCGPWFWISSIKSLIGP
jgi:hypothetical protein